MKSSTPHTEARPKRTRWIQRSRIAKRARNPYAYQARRPFEVLERRDLLAAEVTGGGTAVENLLPGQAISVVYGAINQLDVIGQKFERGLDNLDDAGLIGTAGNTAIQLLGLDDIPIIQEGLGELADVGGMLRSLAARAGTAAVAEMASENVAPTYGPLAANQRISVLTDTGVTRINVPAFTPSDSSVDDIDEWAAELNDHLRGTTVENTVEWIVLDELLDPDADPVLALVVQTGDEGPVSSTLSVTTAAIELPTPGEFGRPTGDVSFNIQFEMETLIGESTDTPATLSFPAGGALEVHLNGAARSDSPAVPPTGDNVGLQDLADDYNAAMAAIAVEYPAGTFVDGTRAGDAEEAGGDPPITRSLSTFFTVVMDDQGTSSAGDDRLVMVAINAELTEFTIENYRVTDDDDAVISTFNGSTNETDLPVYGTLGIQGVRGTAGIDRAAAIALEAAGVDGTSEETHDEIIEGAIGSLMDRLGIPMVVGDFADASGWRYLPASDELRFQLVLDESFAHLVNLDLDRSIELGPLGNLELVAQASAGVIAGVGLKIEFGVFLGAVPGALPITADTPVQTLDAGRGLRGSVGIAAASPPESFILASDLTLPIDVDGETVVIVVDDAATTDNLTLADLASDITAAIVGTPLHPDATTRGGRIEIAAVDGALHIRAIDESIRTVTLGELEDEAVRASGFRAFQASSNPVASLGGRVAYPDLRIAETDSDGMVTEVFLVDLDQANTIAEVALAISAASDHITAVFDGTCFIVTNTASEFTIDAADRYGLRSFAPTALRISGDSEPREGTTDHVLTGTSLRTIPLADRMFVAVPPEGSNVLNVSLELAASDLELSAALGFIELAAVTSTNAAGEVDPLTIDVDFPIRLQAPADAVSADRISIGELSRLEIGSLFAPVAPVINELSATFGLRADLFDSVDVTDVDGLSGNELAKISLGLAVPGDLSSITFTPTVVDPDQILEQLREISIEQVIGVARDAIESLTSGSEDGIADKIFQTDLPLVGVSLEDIIQLADDLIDAVERVVSSVDTDSVIEALDTVETAIVNFPVPREQKSQVLESVRSVRGVVSRLIEATEAGTTEALALIPKLTSRLIAAGGQLDRFVGNLSDSMPPGEGSEFDFDVSGDSYVTALDALMIINLLNRTDLPDPIVVDASNRRMDVNRDGFVTALDALMVINAINETGSSTESDSGESSEPVAGTMAAEDDNPLRDQLLAAIAGLRLLLPSINDITDRIESAVRSQLPATSELEFTFDIVPDFDGDASATSELAVIGGIHGDYDFGPYEFDPELDFGDLGPISLDLDTMASFSGSIEFGVGFGVRIDPSEPSNITPFVVAGGTDIENITATQLSVRGGFDADVNAAVSIAGTELIGLSGELSLSDPDDETDADSGTEGLASFDLKLLSTATVGPYGSIDDFSTLTIDTELDGEIAASIDASLLGRTVEDILEVRIPLSDLSASSFTVDTDRLSSLFSELDFDLLTILAGIETFLGTLSTQLTDNLDDVPLIGGGLEDVGELIEQLNDRIVTPIREQLQNFGGTLDAVKFNLDRELTEALQEFGFIPAEDAMGNPIDASGDQIEVVLDQRTFEIRTNLSKRFDLLNVDFDSNFGPLPLSASGGVTAALTLGLNLGMGVSRDNGFYLITGDLPEITASIDAGITPGTALEMDLFILNVSASDDIETDEEIAAGADPMSDEEQTRAHADLAIDWDANETLAVTDVFSSATISGGGGVNIDLDVRARTGFDLAEVSTELQAGWGFTFSTGSGFVNEGLYFALNNIELNLGEFLGKTIAPTIRKLDDVIGPVRDVVDLLTTPIPGVSDLAVLAGADPVTLLDLALAEMSPGAAAAARKFVSVIVGIDDVTGKIAELLGPEGPDSEDLILNFGSIQFNGDGVVSNDLAFGTSLDGGDGLSVDNDTNDDPFGSLGERATSLVSSLSAEPAGGEEDDDGLGISFPIFEPSNIIKLLLGQTVDLVVWDIPKLELDFGWSQTFPIFPVPPISVGVGLDVGFSIDLLVGLDTRGLKTGGLLDGFYLGDLDPDTDVDIEEFVFSLGVSLAALLDVGVASAGIEGEIRGELGANFRDPDNNGKLYIDELIGIIEDEGIQCVFDLEARVRAILRVVFKVLFFEGSIDIIDVIIFQADNGGLCPAVNPAHVADGGGETDGFSNVLPDYLRSLVTGPMVDGQEVAREGTLIVHSGAFARQRGRGASDTSEDFTLRWIAPGIVQVIGMGLDRQYAGVTQILFDGGLGVDQLNLRVGDGDEATAANFPLPIFAHGGAGTDVLEGGRERDTILGGLDDDEISGNGGRDILGGDGGNDLIDGGDGDDIIAGGPGRETIDGGNGDDQIFGNSGDDTINAGPGNDLVLGMRGNDTIRGGSGNDSIRGDEGDDFIDAGAGDDPYVIGGIGNDLLIGDDGKDDLFGGWGNDVIIAHRIEVGGVGGPDADYIEGGPDDDFICGSAGQNTIHGGTTDRGIDEAGVSFEAIVPLTPGGYSITSCSAAAPPPPIESVPILLSGNVFRDLDRNAVRTLDAAGRPLDSEPLLDGVTIRIYDADNLIAAEITTGPIDLNGDGTIDPKLEIGQWSIDSLDAGSYRVEVVLPPLSAATAPFAPFGTDPSYSVTLAARESASSLDFGLARAAILSGIQFLDLNSDGVQQANEPGMAGVEMNLVTRGGLGTLFPIGTSADNPTTAEVETGMFELTLPPDTYSLTTATNAAGLVIAADPLLPSTVATSPLGGYLLAADYESILNNTDFGNTPASEIHVVLTQAANPDVVLAQPPETRTAIGEGENYLVELWVSGGGAEGDADSVTTTLNYQTQFTTAYENILYGGAFTDDRSIPTFDDGPAEEAGRGTVGNLSASLGANTTFTTGYRKFATLVFGAEDGETSQDDQLQPRLSFAPEFAASSIVVSTVGQTRPQLYIPDDPRIIVDRFDMNDDSVVDDVDLDLVAEALGLFVEDAGRLGRRLDLNESGRVDVGDVAMMRTRIASGIDPAVEVILSPTIPVIDIAALDNLEAAASVAAGFDSGTFAAPEMASVLLGRLEVSELDLVMLPMPHGIRGEGELLDLGVAADALTAADECLTSQLVCVPDGSDIIQGHGEDDLIRGDNTVDPLMYQSIGQSDTIYGGAGRDDINGQDRDDILWGGDDVDPATLPNDESENDHIVGGDGTDQLRQRAVGDQSVFAAEVKGQGTDTFESIEVVYLFADDSGPTLQNETYAGPVVLTGGAGKDTLIGGPGDDVLNGLANDDILVGNNGNDQYVFSGSAAAPFGTDQIVETGSDKGDEVNFSLVDVAASPISLAQLALFSDPVVGAVTSTSFANLENVVGTHGDDKILGNGGVNRLDGNIGDDDISGGSAGDIIIGGPGKNMLRTSPGGDTFVFFDAVSGDDDSIFLDGSAFALDFSGLVDDVGVDVDLSDGVIASHGFRDISAVNHSIASLDNVTIIGSAYADLFVDIAGRQDYRGGDGDDVYRLDGSSIEQDKVREFAGGGDDTLELSSFTNDLTIDISGANSNVVRFGTTTRVVATGATQFENVVGGSGDDSITGNAADNSIFGGPGDDTMIGLAGNDVYRFGDDHTSQDDTILEAAGGGVDRLDLSDVPDQLFGGGSSIVDIDLAAGFAVYSSTSIIFDAASIEDAAGSRGTDIIRGSDGDNHLFGGDGDDELYGGFGNDVLDGGDGNDSYRFDTLRRFSGGTGAVPEVETILDSGGRDEIVFSSLSAADAVDLLVNLNFDETDLVIASHGSTTAGGSRTVFVGDLSTRIEDVRGSIGDDTILGDDFANELSGGSGNDLLRGGRGDDVLDAGSGDDDLDGGRDRDVLFGSAGRNRLAGGPGDDTYIFQKLFGSVDADNILVEYPASVMDGSLVDGGSDTIVLPTFVNTFSLANFAAAGTADPPELVPGFSSGANRITFDLIGDGIRDGSQFENLISDSAVAFLTGNASDNLIYGGQILFGGNGNDVLIGRSGSDTIAGGSDDDLIIGGDVRFFPPTFDSNRTELMKRLLLIQQEWNRDIPVSERIAALVSGVGEASLNARLIQGDSTIADTVIDDGLVDAITVGIGEFWVLPPDVPSDPPAGSTTMFVAGLSTTQIASDSDVGAMASLGTISDDVASKMDISPSLEELQFSRIPAEPNRAEASLQRVRIRAVSVFASSTASTPPVGLERLDEGKAFMTEIWVQTTSGKDPGLAGLFVDVSMNPAQVGLTADSIQLNGAFAISQRGSIVASAGLVDDAGGLTQDSDFAAGGSWVRLATIAMTAVGHGSVRISPLPGILSPALIDGTSVPWTEVVFESASLVIDTPFPNQNPINRFDVDNNGVVDPFDLFILKNYLETHSETEPPPVDPQNPIYLDVVGDNQIDPLDLLALANHLNESSRPSRKPTDDELTSLTEAVDAVFASLA
ncbi:dockerin type I domain-containing protein [Allorhodopirellula heiligendammensis]|uniref:Bifunctional hemolysin/adenylate cyclase n=1 Tax=Allorhodopirellula heiligendammensis TaxID=2714739 RepID=A0A5C6BT55_9BACT|nr:dockerin type I domain-containing protein [Allorhodopirellula heiligendammensis]TWU15165.1 Bifunctional hemolysin/adenylate cyclase precursor [Allorhodopirellula heiligendammensis]